jgi:hypothetical protein
MLGVLPTPWWLPWLQVVAAVLACFFGWGAFRARAKSGWVSWSCVALLLFCIVFAVFPLVPAKARRAYHGGKDQFGWVAQLRSEDSAERQEAVVALCEIVRGGSLRDPGWDARIATLLGELGPEAGTALPTLRELLHHEDREVRRAAQEAIQRIEAKAPKQVQRK